MSGENTNMRVESTLNIVKMYAEQCGRLLPEVDQIENFEKTITQYNQLMCPSGELFQKLQRKARENVEVYSKLGRCDNSQMDQKKAYLLKLQSDIEKLSRKIDSANDKYETEVNDKVKVCSALEKQQLEKDCISVFKLGTLSHFSYKTNIKFGYFMNRKTLDFKTFPYNPDTEPSEQEIQIRWDMLKLFMNKGLGCQ